ncbi:opacity protein-like surface antigen [Shimia isoporae]|uniref:Opacity protein-like surface antigen n=1 Tax=Shimia isoporae TaxID=647720 RepID=A0A4V6NFJ9_9RHOB|nr:outer membrane beta-barrel protein [Shimia isoporae]TCL00354.1 opacity protein-like surface antigen [Shimia isoporae]
MNYSSLKSMRAAAVAALVAASAVVAGSAHADTWDGAYFGFQFGAATTDLKDNDAAGLAGLQVGRDWQVGDWVMGVGLDASAMNGKTLGDDFKALGRLKVRGGYDFGRTLLYATTGASYGDHNVLGQDLGYFVGIGVEHKLTENWSISGEIAQHNFGNYNGSGKLEPTVATLGVNFRF